MSSSSKSKAAIPFLEGATNTQQVLEKSHKLIYGKKLFSKQGFNPDNKRERPHVEHLLLHSPVSQIKSIIRNAHLAKEINGDTLGSVLRNLREYGRYDKALQICRAYEEETKMRLRGSHFVSLMTIALNAPEKLESGAIVKGGWKESLRIFSRGFLNEKRKLENPLNSASIGAAFAALAAGGRWRDSVTLFKQSVIDDRMVLEAKAVHALVSQLRRQNKWEYALQTFDTAARSGTKPDYTLYRELLYTIQGTAKLGSQTAADAWRAALTVAAAIEPVCPPNAGIYNTLIETCAMPYRIKSASGNFKFSNHWEAGIRVFKHLQGRAVLSAYVDKSSRTVANSNTIVALSDLRRNDFKFQIKCIEIAREQGLPIQAQVYRNLFTALDKTHRSDEALAFARKCIDDAVIDSSNTGLSLQPMLAGYLDTLAFPANAEAALLAARHMRSALQPVIASSTVGCGVWGDETQSWVVEKGTRVAVIDEGTLLEAARGEMHITLLSQFDAVMVPFSLVMGVLKKLESEANHSKKAQEYTKVLNVLRHLQMLEGRSSSSNDRSGGGNPPVQVLPFVHHLKALQYLEPNEDQVAAHRKVVLEKQLEDYEEEQRKLLGAEDLRQSNDMDLTTNSSPTKDAEEETGFVSAAIKIDTTTTDDGSKKKSIIDEKIMLSTSSPEEKNKLQRKEKQKQMEKKAQKLQKAFWQPTSSGAVKSPSNFMWSHPAATALLLSRLNPDAEITVVYFEPSSSESKQQQQQQMSSLVHRCCDFYDVKCEKYQTLYWKMTRGQN